MKKTKMKKLNSFITRRLTIVTGVLVAVVALSTNVVLGYGPERPTYTTQNAAPHITFNSITNNAAYGDERNFLSVKDGSLTGPGNWKDTTNVEVKNGKEYWVRVLVHNNAKPQLNLVATNTRVAVSVPTAFSNKITIDGYVRADNSQPKEVWDNAVLTSDKKFNIAYVAGSAKYFNHKNLTTGFNLSDNIVTNGGALVGFEKMDGRVQGCYEYSGYAVFKIKIVTDSPDFTVEKSVRLHGTDKWHKDITAKPGQKVDYEIAYTNTGDSNQLNVVAQDNLPKGVKYHNGSTTIKNSANPNGDGLSVKSNDLVSSKGINFGNYAPTANAYIRFTATLPKEQDLAACGKNKLVNTGTVATENGEKSDTATVTVTKDNCVTALPTTGPIEVIAGLLGVAAITIGIVYYVRSRKDLDSALHAAHHGKKPLISPPSAHDHHKHD